MRIRKLTSTHGMDQETWLEMRRRGIGSSDAPAICGLDSYRSPLAVWAEKTGQLDRSEAGETAYWGHKLEEIVAREFAERHGRRVKRIHAILQRHPDEWMIADLDRVVCDSQLVPLEIKTTSERHADEWDKQPPDKVLAQVYHQLAVTEAPYAYVAVLIGGQRYRDYRIDYDRKAISNLIAIERAFWRLVETQTPPPADGSPSSDEALVQLFPESRQGKTQVLPPSASDWISRYREAAERERAASAEKEKYRQMICQALGDAEQGVLMGHTICTWTTTSRSWLDTKALETDHPEIAQKYKRSSSYRVFRLKDQKEG